MSELSPTLEQQIKAVELAARRYLAMAIDQNRLNRLRQPTDDQLLEISGVLEAAAETLRIHQFMRETLN